MRSTTVSSAQRHDVLSGVKLAGIVRAKQDGIVGSRHDVFSGVKLAGIIGVTPDGNVGSGPDIIVGVMLDGSSCLSSG